VSVLDVVRERHDLLRERRRAVDELGYVDLLTEAQLVEETRLLRDVLAAYTAERRRVSPLERRLRAVLDEAAGALDRYDLVRVEQALHDGLRAIWDNRE